MREQTKKLTYLHIVDGESVAGTLKSSTIPGDVKIFGDLMYEGPAPVGLNSEEWVKTRASFLSQNGKPTRAEALRYLAAFEETLKSVDQYDEAIIWLDHRLSDQLLLVRLLDWLSSQARSVTRLSLICAGDYAGHNRFVGLGHLNAEQLVSLAETQLRITADQVRLGQRTWAAFTSPDPTELESVIAADTSALPFLAAALRRHLEQFPWVENGLSRTENEALRSVCARPLSAFELFAAVQKMEDPVFMGDWSFFRILTELASAREPLLLIGDGSPLDLYEHPSAFVAISDFGLRVLEGREDHIQVNGIDRWLGGVHLKGSESAWRWDPVGGRLIQSR